MARGPPSSRGACDFPLAHRAGTWGGDSTCHSREAPWLLPTLLQAPHTPTRAPHCPALPRTGLGRQGQRGGAVRPPTTLGAGPHTLGPGGTLPMPATRSGLSHLARPCRPHLLQAECPPLPSGQHRRPFKANPTARTPPDHAQSERPRAGPASANRPRSSGNETEANQAQPLCALALTRPHGHVLRGRAPWGQGPALEPRPGEPVPGAGARSRAPARCCLLSPARRPASNLLAASSPT